MTPLHQEFKNKKKITWATEHYNMEVKGNDSDCRNHYYGDMVVLRVHMTSTLSTFSSCEAKDLVIITSSSYYLYFTSSPPTNSKSITIEICPHLCGLHSFSRSEFLLVSLLH